jgi:hypothetical protein
MGGESMPLALPAMADRDDMLTAERLAALVLGDPSRKKADGEKLPGVKPASRAHVSAITSLFTCGRGHERCPTLDLSACMLQPPE